MPDITPDIITVLSLRDRVRQLTLKKRFDQNFLIDETILQAIVKAVAPKPGEAIVEVGPGAGFLTEKLLETGCSLTAIEVDREMVAYLKAQFTLTGEAGALMWTSPDAALTLYQADVIQFPFESLTMPTFSVVGNLPYSVTTPLLFKLMGELNEMEEHPIRSRVRQMTVMVQKEVADRMVASPGHKTYGPLSIACQQWFEPKIVLQVPPRSFLPPPKVNSAVVVMTPRTTPRYRPADAKRFSQLVKLAFAQRRKTLWNNLVHGQFLPKDRLSALFEAQNIPSLLRGEALTIEQFGALSDASSLEGM